jgi:hypothetical protein
LHLAGFRAYPSTQEGKAMVEVLQFIFSSFWIWLGTVILAAVIFGPLGSALGAAMCGRKNR